MFVTFLLSLVIAGWPAVPVVQAATAADACGCTVRAADCCCVSPGSAETAPVVPPPTRSVSGASLPVLSVPPQATAVVFAPAASVQTSSPSLAFLARGAVPIFRRNCALLL